MMKTQLIATVLVAVSAAVAAPAFASESTVTRAQVRAELAALQQAGYQPNRPNDPNYPDNIQAALNRIRDHGAVAADTQAAGYGSDAGGATQSGSRNTVRTAERSIYFGH
ncbi:MULTISPECIES: DUF4148 domain-containing protein [Burkholderia]|jgi:hypothetical protein|uniref:DUF4148 domain-containing protein n=2 Tax=Burkholderia cenocepacia TaxID=95486 RepID=A0A142PF14_9BURK|nr:MULTISPECIES: DUF4148 domain-containing protein [Burkholderia]MCM3155810.1 DUF4148 domain-containing protein [Priestia megaterium]MDP9544015.1 type II secretory pathway pseudopilin PulG [Burkholderia cepacia]ALV55589.1 hypothetical protein TQ36_04615 [Burkholderia cenocepacia]AMU06932.1 hypothetical protein A2T82_11835 [Burkholderia cenocepacia]AMU14687.1 hypothetical protein A3203_17040 [Burkholderia cenocepacia]